MTKYMWQKKWKKICKGLWVENIVEKGENTGYKHFLLFPQGFWVKGY